MGVPEGANVDAPEPTPAEPTPLEGAPVQPTAVESVPVAAAVVAEFAAAAASEPDSESKPWARRSQLRKTLARPDTAEAPPDGTAAAQQSSAASRVSGTLESNAA